MDALSRLAPVARPLLSQVDEVLATLGAPADHEVWRLLRRVGATPADAVAGFVELGRSSASIEPGGALRRTAADLRARAGDYRGITIARRVPWTGGAAEAYATTSASLHAYVHDDLAAKLDATASYVDGVAEWQERSRNAVARALAGVLGCAQAVIVRGSSRPGSAAQLRAAADIGAHVLDAVAVALDDGRGLVGRYEELAEAEYVGRAHTAPGRLDATIRLTH